MFFTNVWLKSPEYLPGSNQCVKPYDSSQNTGPINDISACRWTYEPILLNDNTYPNVIFNATLKTCPNIHHNCIDLSHANEIKPLLNSECKPIMGNIFVLIRICNPMVGKCVFKPALKRIVTGYGCVYRSIDTGSDLIGKRQKPLEAKYGWLKRQ